MEEADLLDPFARLLEHHFPLGSLRHIAAGGDKGTAWAALVESGFLDALMPESVGGAGLEVRDIAPLVEALGRHLVPVPVADTMVARALLAGAADIPSGPIVLASVSGGEAQFVPFAHAAGHALIDTGAALALCALDVSNRSVTGAQGSMVGSLCPATPLVSITRPADGLRPLSAVLRAAEMAGVAGRLLDMTVAYANDRVQFGKPIGKQQAVQQQLAILAEKVVMSRMAARIGLDCALVPSLAAAAVAKGIASASAEPIAAIAHAVYGAIGISEECDLQLFTRRLHEWRWAEGAEAYWFRRLGEARLASGVETSAAFVRSLPAQTCRGEI